MTKSFLLVIIKCQICCVFSIPDGRVFFSASFSPGPLQIDLDSKPHLLTKITLEWLNLILIESYPFSAYNPKQPHSSYVVFLIFSYWILLRCYCTFFLQMFKFIYRKHSMLTAYKSSYFIIFHTNADTLPLLLNSVHIKHIIFIIRPSSCEE